jgi:hypothetical protein
MVTPTTAQLPPPGPRRLPATDQPSRRAPQPLPQRCHPRRSSASPTPCGPVPQHTPQSSRRRRIRPQSGLRTYRPSPPAPPPSQFPWFHGQSQPPCGQRSCTAAQYSNAADQHRPTTPATGRRPAKITTIDRPARSSGRRGRGFKSRHPNAKVTGSGPDPVFTCRRHEVGVLSTQVARVFTGGSGHPPAAFLAHHQFPQQIKPPPAPVMRRGAVRRRSWTSVHMPRSMIAGQSPSPAS